MSVPAIVEGETPSRIRLASHWVGLPNKQWHGLIVRYVRAHFVAIVLCPLPSPHVQSSRSVGWSVNNNSFYLSASTVATNLTFDVLMGDGEGCEGGKPFASSRDFPQLAGSMGTHSCFFVGLSHDNESCPAGLSSVHSCWQSYSSASLRCNFAKARAVLYRATQVPCSVRYVSH